MCYRNWDKSMDIGIIELDIQHRNLLDIIGMLDDVIKDESQGKEARRILKELARFIRYHFKTEEDMFIQYNFPFEDAEEHIDEHNRVLTQLDRLNSIKCELKCLKRVSVIAKSLFDGHTMELDKKFGNFLKQQEINKE